MRVLSEREREVLRLRFEEDLTQSEIGSRVGVSQMHVSRLIRQSIARLRDEADAAAELGYGRSMDHWDLSTLDVQPHHPQILHSSRGESRTIAIHLPAGEELQDHEVHERAHLVVVDGEVEVDADGGSRPRRPGLRGGLRPARAPRGARDDRRAPAARARAVARRGPPGRARRLALRL